MGARHTLHTETWDAVSLSFSINWEAGSNVPASETAPHSFKSLTLLMEAFTFPSKCPHSHFRHATCVHCPPDPSFEAEHPFLAWGDQTREQPISAPSVGEMYQVDGSLTPRSQKAPAWQIRAEGWLRRPEWEGIKKQRVPALGHRLNCDLPGAS